MNRKKNRGLEIAHMSDLHYCPQLLEEADRCFAAAIEDAIAREVDVAIISGDSTHHRLDAHSPAFLRLAYRIKQLADHCPVLMLQGTFSHEPLGMLHILALIGAKYPVTIADRIGQKGLTLDDQWIDIDGDVSTPLKLAVTCVPTVNKADLVSTFGAENAGEEMGNQLAAVLASFAASNAAFRASGVPTVLTSHGTVQGSLNETGVPMAGLDHEFTMGSLFAANATATMLGHIHKHQKWDREYQGVPQVIAYAGSPGRFHYGEIGAKYYLVWHLGANSVTVEPVTTPSREMIDLNFIGAPVLSEIEAVAEQCANAFVRVRYQVDQEHAKNVDRKAIEQILAGAAEVKIEGMILTIQRQRCAGISQIPHFPDRFIRWCEITETPKEGLAERVAMLGLLEPEEIFAKIKAGLKGKPEVAVEKPVADVRLDDAPSLDLASLDI